MFLWVEMILLKLRILLVYIYQIPLSRTVDPIQMMAVFYTSLMVMVQSVLKKDRLNS